MEWNDANTSTVAVFIWMIISPFLNRLGVTIDQNACIGFITIIIGLLIARWSARNPNTLSTFGNDDIVQ